MDNIRRLANSDISEVVVCIPEGHQHIRTMIRLKSGEEITLQEATMANLLRAFITVKTHPTRNRLRLVSREMLPEEKKEGFAEWQLMEEE